jgi:hypothetical protein
VDYVPPFSSSPFSLQPRQAEQRHYHRDDQQHGEPRHYSGEAVDPRSRRKGGRIVPKAVLEEKLYPKSTFGASPVMPAGTASTLSQE